MSAPVVAAQGAAAVAMPEDVAQWDSVQTYVTELTSYCSQLRWSANELEEEAREIRRALAMLERKQQVQRVLFEDANNDNDNDEIDEVDIM